MLAKMKRGKAAGPDGLTVEHLTNNHPILLSILAKLLIFVYLLDTSQIPASTCSKILHVGDFRGISISPVMSKLFEHCLLHRFGYFFGTSDTVINLALNMDWAPRMPFTRYDV